MAGYLDLGSSATQAFISFPSGAFLSLLSQISVSLQVLSCSWCRAYKSCFCCMCAFFPNSAKLSSTRNFFIIFNRAFIVFNRPFTYSFVYSICGNKGCACYSRAVLREWAQHSCLCLVLCSEVWILCTQYNCLLLGFDVQVQLYLAQCRKSLLGQEVEQKGKETSLCKLLELLL